MSGSDRPDAGGPGPTKATETLSQFLARVLDQLSMSSWLPSAALVACLGLALAIRRTLDAGDALDGPANVLARAFGRIADIGLGGAVVAIGAVVVLTIVTQAFVFESIRVLEGYWGTSKFMERIARARCRRHAARAASLRAARKAALKSAWKSAKRAIKKEERRRRRKNLDVYMTTEMIEVLRAAIFKQRARVSGVSPELKKIALAYPWRNAAKPDRVRRIESLDKALRDYPRAGRENPTTLGNVLRAHEEATKVRRPESFVQRVFDHLPFTMQVDHDDARNRLDLYSALVFVLPLTGLLAFGLLTPAWGYAGTFLGVCVVGSLVSYLAAIASAQAYGLILRNVADYVRAQGPPLSNEISA